ncbi:MAG: glycosyltransferase family 4 protein [Acidobacteriota bacterium]
MKIAFVIQRYGSEILGGSEYHCRLIAERLAQRHEVDVLTTCARDYITWRNEYQEGTDRVRGVSVRRFASARERVIEDFNRYSDWIFHHPHSRADEVEWLQRQGPWSPALFEYVARQHGSYDLLIFFTYLYAPTVLGLQVSPSTSILVPTAHDEPAIHLGIYREVFSLPAAIAYNTEVERRFLISHFPIAARAEETIGCGVEVPQQPHARRQDEATDSDESRTLVELALRPPRSSSRGAAFRRRHKLSGPYALYGGRIERGKGCEELVEYFSAYHAGGGEATLVLMGVKLMPLPEEPFVRFAGLLPERERLQALEAATVVIVPSPFESLSLLALEAFAVGTPILANARSDVLVDHCLRSNAGLYYADREEFIEGLTLLMADECLRSAMGRNGRAYVREHYRWDVILGKYERLIGKVMSGDRR